MAVKASNPDLVAILRRFSRATDDDTAKSIAYVTFTHPFQETTIYSFRFQKKRFVVVFDSKANDDLEEARALVAMEHPNDLGEFIKAPEGHKEYAIHFKGHDTYLFEVTPAKHRLDLELAARYPDTSRSTLQKYIKNGFVSVDGHTETSPKFDVADTADIAVAFPEKEDFSEHELPIIYLDDNVIVINKPVGVLTHSKGALNDEFTVAEFFRRYTTFNLESNRPGIVHRLDRDTSGVMIGARNPETATLLQKQFADRKTKKTYVAIVDGQPKLDSALIDLPIGRHPNAPSTFRVDTGGKPAQTSYDVLETTGELSLIKLAPKTGRTHQLRVHMAYLNTPIHGDRVYGKATERLYLHALSLEVTIPISDRRTFTAPLPSEYLELFPGAKV